MPLIIDPDSPSNALIANNRRFIDYLRANKIGMQTQNGIVRVGPRTREEIGRIYPGATRSAAAHRRFAQIINGSNFELIGRRVDFNYHEMRAALNDVINDVRINYRLRAFARSVRMRPNSAELVYIFSKIRDDHLPDRLVNINEVETRISRSGIVYHYFRPARNEHLTVRAMLKYAQRHNLPANSQFGYKYLQDGNVYHGSRRLDHLMQNHSLMNSPTTNVITSDDVEWYSDNVQMLNWYTASPRQQGGCCVKHECELTIGKFLVKRLKISCNNCLIACFTWWARKYGRLPETGKKLREKSYRKLLHLGQTDDDMLTITDAKALALFFACYTRIFLDSNSNEFFPIGDPASKYTFDILLEAQHYYPIIRGAPESGLLHGVALSKAASAPVEENIIAAQPEEDISREQLARRIVDEMKQVAYIDGSAGTGKSHLISLICDVLCERGITFAKTASTGIAAINIDGYTIDYYMCRNWSDEFVIIDEVSLISAVKMDRIMRYFDCCATTRLILVGDSLQLPAVGDNGLDQGQFFQSDLLLSLRKTSTRYTLTKNYRSVEPAFTDMLMRVRSCAITQLDYNMLRERVVEKPQLEKYDIVIFSKRKNVAAHNARMLSLIPGDVIEYRPTYTILMAKKDAKPNEKQIKTVEALVAREHPVLQLKLGARVRITKNHKVRGDERVFNGELGRVVHLNPLTVELDRGIIFEAVTVDDEYAKPSHTVVVKYYPIALSYAVTYHCCQGLTIKNCNVLVSTTELWSPRTQFLYVALSRFTKMSDVHITNLPPLDDFRDTISECRRFVSGKSYLSYSERIIQDSAGELDHNQNNGAVKPLKVNLRKGVYPHSVLYFDFETATDERSHVRPYLVTYIHEQEKATIESGVVCDIPGFEAAMKDRGCRQKVVEASPVRAIIDKIEQMVIAFEEHAVQKLNGKAQFSAQKRKMCAYLSSICPRLCAFNGSAFDYALIMKNIIGHFTRLEFDDKYTFQIINKGSLTVCFSIINRNLGCSVAKIHDLCQVVPATLKNLCRDFLDSDKKLSFKDEIMDISKHRYDDWASYTFADYYKEHPLLRKSNVGKKLSFQRWTKFNESTYRPADVIEYAIRDTDVLKRLYGKINVVVETLTKDHGRLNAFNFQTVGSLTWYLSMRYSLNTIPLLNSSKSHRSNGQQYADIIDIYSLDAPMDKFIRESIVGGRSCPRILHSFDGMEKYYYLDISGMYGNIMSQCKMPHGMPKWYDRSTHARFMASLQSDYERICGIARERGIAPIHCLGMSNDTLGSLSKAFFVRATYVENTECLEPVLPIKIKGQGMRYAYGEQTRVCSSLDLLLILLKGGRILKFTGCVLAFEGLTNFLGAAMNIYIENKNRYKATNPQFAAMNKLLANSCYGQTLKRDHDKSYQFIVSSPDSLERFLSEYKFDFAIPCGKADIVYGRKKNLEFKTQRNAAIGAFVLAYSRLMVLQIENVINPECDVRAQPVLGDTDSLLVPEAGAWRLRNWTRPETNRPWYPTKAGPGELADELADTLLKKKIKIFPDELGIPVVDFFSPCPKVLAVKIQNGTDFYYKFRCKGVSTSAFVSRGEDHEIMSASVLFASKDGYMSLFDGHSNKGICADMPNRLAKFGIKQARNDHNNLFEIISCDMERNLLAKAWTGRKKIDGPFTVPHGWTPREERRARLAICNADDIADSLSVQPITMRAAIAGNYTILCEDDDKRALLEEVRDKLGSSAKILGSLGDHAPAIVVDIDKCELGTLECIALAYGRDEIYHVDSSGMDWDEEPYELDLSRENLTREYENARSVVARDLKYATPRPLDDYTRFKEALEAADNYSVIVRDECDRNKFKIGSQASVMQEIISHNACLHETVSNQYKRRLFFDIDGGTKKNHEDVITALKKLGIKFIYMASADLTTDSQSKVSSHIYCQQFVDTDEQRHIQDLIRVIANVDAKILDDMGKSVQGIRMPLCKNEKGRTIVPINLHSLDELFVTTWIPAAIVEAPKVERPAAECKNAPLLRQLCDMLTPDYFDDYGKWFRLMCCLSSENAKEVALEYSQRSAKFNASEFESLWASLSSTKLGINSLHYYARTSNPAKYTEAFSGEIFSE